MKKILFILLFFSLSLTSISYAGPLEEAETAYQKQDKKEFEKALKLYREVLTTDGASSELYYNIGNTYYRLGNIGKAVLYYERALRLDPSNKDARANLDFVNSNIKGLPEDNSSFVSNINNNIKAIASPNGWAIITLVLFLIIIGCVATYLFVSNVTLRRIGFYSGFAFIALFVYSFVIAWQTASAPENHEVGIVIASDARLTSNPNSEKGKKEKAVTIPEGAKINIIDSLATPNDQVTSLWYKIELAGGTEAWIDSKAVERI